jgi:hypothetical protein
LAWGGVCRECAFSSTAGWKRRVLCFAAAYLRRRHAAVRNEFGTVSSACRQRDDIGVHAYETIACERCDYVGVELGYGALALCDEA